MRGIQAKIDALMARTYFGDFPIPLKAGATPDEMLDHMEANGVYLGENGRAKMRELIVAEFFRQTIVLPPTVSPYAEPPPVSPGAEGET